MHPQRIAVAVLAAAVLLSLSACSSGDDRAAPQPSAATPKATTVATAPATTAAGTANELGKAVQTDGDQSTGGVLELTPTSVIYLAKTAFDVPTNGLYAVITVKAKSMTAVSAQEAAPISGGGWTYIAPDGQAITTLSGNATNVVPNGFEGGGAVEQGTFQWESEAFDITPAQAGGTLSYKDGNGHVSHWKLPKTTSGPEVAKVEKSLK